MKNLTEYLEVHFEMASAIERGLSSIADTVANRTAYTGGHGALYELAKSWTDEFMAKYEGVVWGEELEFFDTLEQFIDEKETL